MIKIVKLRKFTDKRGSLVENTSIDIMMNSKHFFVSKSKSGVVRGNHYHLHKSEWFYVIQGTCEIHVEDIETKERTSVVISAMDTVMIHMSPQKAHAFKNIGNDELILMALVNIPHDQSKPDTFPYKLL